MINVVETSENSRGLSVKELRDFLSTLDGDLEVCCGLLGSSNKNRFKSVYRAEVAYKRTDVYADYWISSEHFQSFKKNRNEAVDAYTKKMLIIRGYS